MGNGAVDPRDSEIGWTRTSRTCRSTSWLQVGRRADQVAQPGFVRRRSAQQLAHDRSHRRFGAVGDPASRCRPVACGRVPAARASPSAGGHRPSRGWLGVVSSRSVLPAGSRSSWPISVDQLRLRASSRSACAAPRRTIGAQSPSRRGEACRWVSLGTRPNACWRSGSRQSGSTTGRLVAGSSPRAILVKVVNGQSRSIMPVGEVFPGPARAATGRPRFGAAIPETPCCSG